MSDAYPAIGLGIFVIFVVISAVMYGFAGVIGSITDSDIEEKVQDGNKRAIRIRKLIDSYGNLTNFVNVTAIIMNMVAGGFIFIEIDRAFKKLSGVTTGIEAFFVSFAVAGVMFTLLAVFGIIVPRKIFCMNSEKWAFKLVNFVTFLMVLMTPVTFMVTKISNGIVRIFGIDPNSDEENVTEEGIIDMVNEGQEQGVLLASEAEMITNIVEFGDKEAKDIMTHRKSIEALDGHMSINQVFEALLDSNFSRYPVYDSDLDDMVGILHFKDLVKAYSDGFKRNYSLIELKDEILFPAECIPETKNIDALFKFMQAAKLHMAIVVDEYGQTSGIVTMEDILEEIVGNIADEHDEEEESIHQNSNGTYEIEGLALLEDIEEMLGIKFDNDDVETLNGFLTHRHGLLPQDGEQFYVDYEGYRFKVVEVADKLIKKVIVTALPKQEVAQGGQDE
ncbi:MAG: hemolysin family protein [Lachnospiraceae bacterium]